MINQCSDCGGFCKKSGCERENVKPAPKRKPLTDEEVEKIIKSNMSLQMNLAGIRADIEAAYNIKE